MAVSVTYSIRDTRGRVSVLTEVRYSCFNLLLRGLSPFRNLIKLCAFDCLYIPEVFSSLHIICSSEIVSVPCPARDTCLREPVLMSRIL
jgi:hypothetical protein